MFISLNTLPVGFDVVFQAGMDTGTLLNFC